MDTNLPVEVGDDAAFKGDFDFLVGLALVVVVFFTAFAFAAAVRSDFLGMVVLFFSG